MPLQPADLGRHVAGIQHQAGSRPHHRRRHIGDLRLGAPVHPDQAGRDRLALAVDREAAIELAADAERGDLRRAYAGLRQGAGDGRAERMFPQPRILFRPAVTREVRPVGHGRFAADAERVVGDRCLEALCADIDADDHGAPRAAVLNNSRGPARRPARRS